MLVPSVAALALAGILQARRCGYGTHEELGLPACSSVVTTGYPCPTCGLTTSMAAMAHGQIGLAVQAHPFGVIAFVAAAALAVGGILEVFTGRDWLRYLRLGPWWIAAGLGGLLIGWAVKLAVGWATGAFPIR